MATDIKKTDLRGLMMKIQAVAGTPEALVVGTDGILVMDGQFMFETDPLERKIDKPGHGARPFVNVKRRSRFQFGIELRGNAVVGAAAPIGTVLRACGFSQALVVSTSAIYSLVTSGHEIVTLEGYSHGQKVTGNDARGVLSSIELSIRNFAMAKVDVLGLAPATPVADAALPAIVTTNFQAPRAIETATFEVDIGGFKLNAISLNIDTNAAVEIYEGSEQTFVFYKEFYRPTGTLRVFKDTRASWHPENISLANTLSDVYATISGGGETVRLDLDSVQIGIPKLSDEGGVAAWDIPLSVVGSTATDALKLSFLV